MKNFIKKLPLIGFLGRYLYNLLRINNIKHRLVVLENLTITQQRQIQDQQQQIDALKNELESSKNIIDFKLADLMLHHSLSLRHRIDQFVFDANIELKNSINSPEEKLLNIAAMATKLSDEK
ncbi:MAG: hypothetical protein PHQ93_01675 [Sulfurimonas sp.]|uniref:hypothetical protein n=1 Tax=Sulfurimonas sp. TaxID=2022749 RepID=UPI0026329B02|nr:hypothetical protein [Sulfurimonas sp.]MDD5399884.1 hypothetical protein [Sulfurimonas sp.]